MTESIRVVVGSGVQQNNPGWVHTQEEELNLLRLSDWESKFALSSIEAILAEHVWEHLTYEEGIQAATICYSFLQPGGYVRCAVPDGYFPNQIYQNIVQAGGPGPKDHPAASHKIVYTYQTFRTMFETAGFNVELLEYCDESGQFHAQDWDETMGFIYRSKRFDHRNKDGILNMVSLIVDAKKPAKEHR